MKLLVFAHVPPPHHGQSYAVKLMLENFGGNRRKSKFRNQPPNRFGIECYHVNARLSKNLEDVGKFRSAKILLILFYCLQAIWCRFRYGVKNFYYVPSCGNRAALCRDWLVMLICRPFFKRMVFHWHNAGIAKWLETSVQIRTRSITYQLMKDAQLSIAPSEQNRRDAEKLLPAQVITLSGNRDSFLAELAKHLRGLEDSVLCATASKASLKLALTILAENPLRKTGLTTTFHEFVSRSLQLFPDVSWVIFAGPNQEWTIRDPRVEVVRDFPANDKLNRRLFADHFRVPAAARKRGAHALLTVGFVPTRKCLPTVLHIYSLQTLDKRNRLGFFRQFYRNSMMKYNWPQADLVVTNSRWTANQVLSQQPKLRGRMITSYEGLQHETFQPLPTQNESAQIKEQLDLKPGYFLWVSNFYPYKQAELLIASYARLKPETRQRHPLVMVGGNWLNGLDTARSTARTLGIEKDVHFLGWVDDSMLAPLYRHAAAFCLPSREETFGRCVIEAMACGTPCIVNDIPIMHEVTAGHALIVNYRDADAVAGALQKLIADDNLINRLRADGISRAQEFTFEKLASERITAIRHLAGAIHGVE
ncbi:MAG TPA: glycosyltransferase family 1 protein [Methylomirabilota bacterium]|nr:glycosyltransferase family 1 protein [Methylomirabilota bacterium]